MEEKSNQSREKFDNTACDIIGEGFKLSKAKKLSETGTKPSGNRTVLTACRPSSQTVSRY